MNNNENFYNFYKHNKILKNTKILNEGKLLKRVF